jgi:hypothetical protein
LKQGAKRISTIIIGRTLKEFYDHLIDYVLYPLVLLSLGYWKGFVCMICITALENVVMIVLYNRMKIDWLGYGYIETIKQWTISKTGIRQIIGSLVIRSTVFLFFFLSLFRDSFETTAYFQLSIRSKYKLTAIFIGSLLIGNLYWSLGVEVFINSWLRKLINY